jgi:hypothetical protein
MCIKYFKLKSLNNLFLLLVSLYVLFTPQQLSSFLFSGYTLIISCFPKTSQQRKMIYNTQSQWDRLIVELQARCGLRIGELLKIRVSDVSGRSITLREPKSGKEAEMAYMPEKPHFSRENVTLDIRTGGSAGIDRSIQITS